MTEINLFKRPFVLTVGWGVVTNGRTGLQKIKSGACLLDLCPELSKRRNTRSKLGLKESSGLMWLCCKIMGTKEAQQKRLCCLSVGVIRRENTQTHGGGCVWKTLVRVAGFSLKKKTTHQIKNISATTDVSLPQSHEAWRGRGVRKLPLFLPFYFRPCERNCDASNDADVPKHAERQWRPLFN